MPYSTRIKKHFQIKSITLYIASLWHMFNWPVDSLLTITCTRRPPWLLNKFSHILGWSLYRGLTADNKNPTFRCNIPSQIVRIIVFVVLIKQEGTSVSVERPNIQRHQHSILNCKNYFCSSHQARRDFFISCRKTKYSMAPPKYLPRKALTETGISWIIFILCAATIWQNATMVQKIAGLAL